MRDALLENRISAHIACRPWSFDADVETGCFVICSEHKIRQSYGSAHAVARAACIEHNRTHHAAQRSAPSLLSVIYESAATRSFDSDDLAELLHTARNRNRAAGITGMLLAEDGWFLQALEGPAPLVEKLMRSIQEDSRHSHVRILTQEFRTHRRFPDWAMAEGHIGEVESRPLAQFYEAMLAARGQVELARQARTEGN